VVHCVTKSAIVDHEPKGEKDGARQAVFVGTFKHCLDPKKRLTIPSEWREQTGSGSGLYVLPDVTSRCLCVFPASEMSRRLEKIRDHSISDRKARQFARALASRSDLVTWDSQGRIRIKDELLAFADLQGDVVMVGTFHSFELWSPAHFEKEVAPDEADIREAARYVGF